MGRTADAGATSTWLALPAGTAARAVGFGDAAHGLLDVRGRPLSATDNGGPTWTGRA